MSGLIEVGGDMGFFARVFSSPSVVKEGIDLIRDTGDALVYTDEERERDKAQIRELTVAWMEATQGQNLARRLIALSITGVWLLMYIVSVFCSIAAVFVDHERMHEVSIIATSAATEMDSAVMLILAFYFAAPHMGDLARAVVNKGVK